MTAYRPAFAVALNLTAVALRARARGMGRCEAEAALQHAAAKARATTWWPRRAPSRPRSGPPAFPAPAWARPRRGCSGRRACGCCPRPRKGPTPMADTAASHAAAAPASSARPPRLTTEQAPRVLYHALVLISAEVMFNDRSRMALDLVRRAEPIAGSGPRMLPLCAAARLLLAAAPAVTGPNGRTFPDPAAWGRARNRLWDVLAEDAWARACEAAG